MENLVMGGRWILVLNKYGGGGGRDYLQSEQGPVADYFKHGTGPPALIEGEELTVQLRDCWLIQDELSS